MRATLGCLLFLTLVVPTSAAPDLKKPASIDDSAQIADKLLERIDVQGESQSLKDTLSWLYERCGLMVLIDYKAFGAETAQTLDDASITLRTMKNVRIETVLRRIADQIDGDFLIAPDHVKFTTAAVKDAITGHAQSLPDLYGVPADEARQVERNEQVRTTPYVTVSFKETPAVDAFKQMASRAGRNVVVSAPAAEKAKTAITVNLSNVAFETAAASIAEAAGLRAFRTGNVVVIVTAERAKQVEGETHRLQQGFPLGLGDPGNVDAKVKELEEKLKKLTEELEKSKK